MFSIKINAVLCQIKVLQTSYSPKESWKNSSQFSTKVILLFFLKEMLNTLFCIDALKMIRRDSKRVLHCKINKDLLLKPNNPEKKFPQSRFAQNIK